MLGCLVCLAVFVVLALAVRALVKGYKYRRDAGRATTTASMKGKTVIITGASAGIGKEAARDMSRRGARVILACRNRKKAEDVADKIRSSTGNSEVLVRLLDTSSLDSVRSFAAKILAEESRLDVLVLNAGIVGPRERTLTADGLELVMATNHLGHFLLANLLLGLVKKSSPSRVVVVASVTHKFTPTLDPKDLSYESGKYKTINAYARSKFCNILFAHHLAEMLKGTGVVVNALCPGYVYTDIFQTAGDFRIGTYLRLTAPFMAKTEEQGAQTIIHLAVSEEAATITGEFFEDCKVSKQASPQTQDLGLAKKVWEVSEEHVHLKPEERCY